MTRGQLWIAPFFPTYLNDHLVDARVAISVLRDLSVRATSPDLRLFFKGLLVEVTEDHDTLWSLAHRLHADPTIPKIIPALVSERLERLAPRLASPDAGTILEVLEDLELGIRGKLALWDALVALPHDSRVADLKLGDLRARALSQLERVERERLTYAILALGVGRPPLADEASSPPLL